MRSYSVVSLLLLITIIFGFLCDMYLANAIITCRRCEPLECEQDPPNICVWGESRDACGRRVCSKGPGEKCGGPSDVYGSCGEGMYCKKDGKCYGCSIQTMECFT